MSLPFHCQPAGEASLLTSPRGAVELLDLMDGRELGKWRRQAGLNWGCKGGRVAEGTNSPNHASWCDTAPRATTVPHDALIDLRAAVRQRQKPDQIDRRDSGLHGDRDKQNKQLREEET